MGFLNLIVSTIIYPQICASKAQECNENRRIDQGKGSTLLFLLQGGGWGELTSSVQPHTCSCTLK